MNAIATDRREAAKLQAEHYPEVTGRRYDVPADRALSDRSCTGGKARLAGLRDAERDVEHP